MIKEPFIKGQKVRIVLKTLLGTINYSGKLVIVKYVSLVYIGLTYNISPVATVVLSYFILGERLSLMNLVLFAVTLTGVVLIILGYKDDYYMEHSHDKYQISTIPPLWAVAFLITMPIW